MTWSKNLRSEGVAKVSVLSSKKGFGFGEAIMLLIVVFLFAILSVTMYSVYSGVNDDLQADPDLSATAKDKLQDLDDRFPATMDGAFALIFGLLFLVGIIASLMFDSHPAFMVVIILLMIFLMIAGGFISNSWDEFVVDNSVSSFSSSFPYTSYIMNNLMLIIGVTMITFGGVIYFKQRN